MNEFDWMEEQVEFTDVLVTWVIRQSKWYRITPLGLMSKWEKSIEKNEGLLKRKDMSVKARVECAERIYHLTKRMATINNTTDNCKLIKY
jgi:hypothetical protein